MNNKQQIIAQVEEEILLCPEGDRKVLLQGFLAKLISGEI